MQKRCEDKQNGRIASARLLILAYTYKSMLGYLLFLSESNHTPL
jgi:hypothetical protein